MSTYKITQDGQFLPYQPAPIELEQRLEEWLERNPQVLLEGESVLVIGRQVRTNLNRPMDLLAVAQDGRVVVVELKKDRAPRDVVAQILEYSAFIQGLRYDELNLIAGQYYAGRDDSWHSLNEAHAAAFQAEPAEGDGRQSLAWNEEQILLLVAGSFPPEVVDVARFLRNRNIDIRCLEITVHADSTDQLIAITHLLLGSEPLPRDAARQAASEVYPAIAGMREKVEQAIRSFGEGTFRLSDFYLRFAEKFPEDHQELRSRYTNPRFNDRVYLGVQFDAARKRGYITAVEPEDKVAVEGWPYPLALFRRT